MGEIKFDQKADGIGYLYRCAYFLAKGDKTTSKEFLQKAFDKLGNDHCISLKPLLDNYQTQLTSVNTITDMNKDNPEMEVRSVTA